MSDPDAISQRWKVVCSYDGTSFDGWQSQVSGNAVQDHCEAALARLMGQPVRVHGAGRTDAGVHARGQVFHFDGGWNHGPEALGRALTTLLPADIQVRRVEAVEAAFHARFQCRGKRYVYRFVFGVPDPLERRFVYPVYQGPVSLSVMRAAAACLVGVKDFSALSSRIDPQENTIKNVWRVELIELAGNRVDVVVEGDGFLYRMVRRMAGALLRAGLGRLTPSELAGIIEAATPTNAFPTAPAAGLCLEEVFYPETGESG